MVSQSLHRVKRPYVCTCFMLGSSHMQLRTVKPRQNVCFSRIPLGVVRRKVVFNPFIVAYVLDN